MIIINRHGFNGRSRMYKLRRSGDRPLEFEGREIAGVEVASCNGAAITRLAMYVTRGNR